VPQGAIIWSLRINRVFLGAGSCSLQLIAVFSYRCNCCDTGWEMASRECEWEAGSCFGAVWN
jgi:hypothetical protein